MGLGKSCEHICYNDRDVIKASIISFIQTIMKFKKFSKEVYMKMKTLSIGLTSGVGGKNGGKDCTSKLTTGGVPGILLENIDFSVSKYVEFCFKDIFRFIFDFKTFLTCMLYMWRQNIFMAARGIQIQVFRQNVSRCHQCGRA